MSSEDAVEKALELGILYFKHDNFKDAQSLFTKALKLAVSYDEKKLEELRLSHGLSKRPLSGFGELVHPRLVKLLDNRAASWEKLGDLRKALKDACRCVRFEPYNLKSYLRRGKILQKMGKDQDALDNYRDGLRKMREMKEKWDLKSSLKLEDLVKYQISLINNRSNKAQAVSTKEKRVLIPPPTKAFKDLPKSKIFKNNKTHTYLDIVGQCPLEILKVILLNLDARQVARCMLVCKVWQARITNLPEVFNRFDISSCNHRAILSFQKFVNRINHYKEKSTIDFVKFSNSSLSCEPRSLSILIENLQPRVKTLIIHSKTADFEQLTSAFSKNLTLATDLERLSLSCGYRMNPSAMLDRLFLSSLSNISHLDLIFSKCTGTNRSRDISTAECANNVKLQRLKSLKLICDLKNMPNIFPLKPLLGSGPLKRLEKLCICGVSFGAGAKFEWLPHFRNLKELWLENNKEAYLEDFLKVIIYVPVFSRLSKLTFREHRIANQATDLRQYPQLVENTILMKNLNALGHLDLMGSSISSHGLLALLSAFSFDKLKSLNIGDCPYIHFQRGNDNGYMDVRELLKLLPHIEELLLPQSVALDDHCLRLFAQNVRYVRKLRKLDLSLNTSLTGVSIYDLLRALKEEFIVLDKLEIDGCSSIAESTANALKRSDLVKELSCSYEKTSWKTYGVNSLMICN
ncbi:LAFA_0D16578g1_1 [Lachancea sp. 'fantastica']|nr:LAFA_0D16578g1_1 [Lachancea sp. 'fantastica']